MFPRWSTEAWTSARRRWTVCLALIAAAAPPAWIGAELWRASDEPLLPMAQAAAAGWRVTMPSGPRDARGDDRSADSTTRAMIASNSRLDVSADVCPSPVIVLASRVGEHPPDSELSWRRRGDPRTYECQGAARDESLPNRLTIPDLPFHPAWKGRIESLEWRLVFHGAPSEVREIGVPSATRSALPGLLWRQWWRAETFSSATINTIRAPHVLGFSPSSLLLLAAVSAIGVYLAAVVGRRGVIRGAVIVAATAAAWLVNDARWAAGQARQLRADAQRRTEATSPDDGAWPGAIAQAAGLLRSAAPRGAVYAVAGGNLAAGDSRLRWLLSPDYVQVNLDPLQPRVAVERAEYVLVLDPRAARFDPASGRLEGAGAPAWRARLVAGAADGLCVLRRVAP